MQKQKCAEIEKNTGGYYAKLHGNKFDNLEGMDKFLEIQSPSKLTQKEIDNLNRQTTRSEIASIIK